MAEREIHCVIDRIEDGVIVLVPDDGSPVLEARAALFPDIEENMSCTAVFSDSVLTKIIARSSASDNKGKLQKLFNKSKNK